MKYVPPVNPIDFNSLRIAPTGHAKKRSAQYIGTRSEKLISHLICCAVQPTKKHINDYFRYTDNRGNVILYSPIVRLFFVVKIEGKTAVVKTLVKERT